MAGPSEYFISSKYGSVFSCAHSHIPDPKGSSLKTEVVKPVFKQTGWRLDLFLILARAPHSRVWAVDTQLPETHCGQRVLHGAVGSSASASGGKESRYISVRRTL